MTTDLRLVVLLCGLACGDLGVKATKGIRKECLTNFVMTSGESDVKVRWLPKSCIESWTQAMPDLAGPLHHET